MTYMDLTLTQRLLLSLILLCLSATKVSAEQGAVSGFEQDQQLFKQALAFSRAKQWKEAESIYRDLLARHQDWPEPKNNLAIVLLNSGRIDEARQTFEQAVSALPEFRISHQNRSKLFDYMASQAYDKALGLEQPRLLPDMQWIESLHPRFQVLEKIVQVEVEKPVKAEPLLQQTEAQEQGKLSLERIENQLQQWVSAWSDGDSEAYLKHYSEKFQPDVEGKNFAQWKYSRRVRLSVARGVDVSIDKLKLFITPEGEQALVEFDQDYRSSTYSDRVLKQLYLQKQQNNWLIVAERVIKTY